MELMSIRELYNMPLFENSFLPDHIKTSQKFIIGDAIKMYIDRYTLAEDVVIYYARMKYYSHYVETWIHRKNGFLNIDIVTLEIYTMLLRKLK